MIDITTVLANTRTIIANIGELATYLTVIIISAICDIYSGTNQVERAGLITIFNGFEGNNYNTFQPKSKKKDIYSKTYIPIDE